MRHRMSLKAKRELLSVTAHRYQAANKKQKQKILDEFVAATGYHRQYAIPLLIPKDDNKHHHVQATVRSSLAAAQEFTSKTASVSGNALK
jgi:hypothetical protein